MRQAVLILDGGFVKKKLGARHKRFPTTADVVTLCEEIMSKPRLEHCELLRVYYYDAPPLSGGTSNPLDGSQINFSGTQAAKQNRELLTALELEPDFAVRRGLLVQNGWKLGTKALRRLKGKGSGEVTSQDLVPDIAQKGVDIRIGLDIATLAIKRIADVIVLVSGDSDFVPPMKFARKEGVRVYLEVLDHGVRRELKAHADFVL